MTTQLSILNTQVRTLNGLHSLNDIHKASGSNKNYQPAFFIRNDQTKALIAEIESENDRSANSQIALKIVKGGRDISKQGTYACAELVIAYAAWISASFHLKVIHAFMALNNITALTSTITAAQQQMIQSAVQQAHHRTGLHYQEIYRLLKVRFSVAKYDQLPQDEFQAALAFINEMKPMLPPPAENIVPLDCEHANTLINGFYGLTRLHDSVYFLLSQLKGFSSKELNNTRFNYEVCDNYIKQAQPIIEALVKTRNKGGVALSAPRLALN